MKMVTNMPQKVRDAVTKLLEARDTWERVNAADTSTKLSILAQNTFLEAESGKRITEINADFLMTDEDFDKYCRMVYEENCRKGFNSGSYEFNFYPFKKKVYEAEDVLIDAIVEDIPEYTSQIVDTLKASPDRRKKFLELLGL